MSEFYIDVGRQIPRGHWKMKYDQWQECIKSECKTVVEDGTAWCDRHLEQLRGGSHEALLGSDS